ncbi:Hypothetical protein Cul131001_1480 [Corynebacterium ulcerans]|nr:Hypothetical protein Cul05146_1425 [Corynebacterium ulcerans]ALD95176.1 Hypothetical protein Cul131001_1480 [Corynebacterium ulcerans]
MLVLNAALASIAQAADGPLSSVRHILHKDEVGNVKHQIIPLFTLYREVNSTYFQTAKIKNAPLTAV